ncbi:glutathione S-transferase family protein [Azospirillum griseum]|uniref:Glutathione S-transferase family protein n=1 Tax=Azospirillum griseum TaxID=2496639 RepID=A0A431VIW8_9PROT|nr:glutathione S-transferase family protein [Azospirillum griseum]RTR21010.1 glutathione S-transferase family protein [Azospirillum griseum]
MLLYQRPTSGHSYKARLLLSFLGIDYESVVITAKDGRNQVEDRYYDLNPRGQIPTLEDDGVVLWGSTAILVYLARRYDPSKSWLPEEPAQQAAVMQWMELAQNEVNGLFLSRAIQRFNYAGDLVAAQKAGNKALDILERRLSGNDWLAGRGPTIGDIACFPYAAVAHDNGFDLAARPAVRAWFSRIHRLPGFVPMPGMQELPSEGSVP